MYLWLDTVNEAAAGLLSLIAGACLRTAFWLVNEPWEEW